MPSPTNSPCELDLVDDVVRPTEGVRNVRSFPYFGIHTHRFLWDVG